MSANSLVLHCHGDTFQRRRDVARWFSAPLGAGSAGCWWDVARCRRLEGPGEFLVELYLENETEVALHRFSQSFPTCSARLASSADFRPVELKPDAGNARLNLPFGDGL
eukprot:s123_g2.t1